MTDGGAPSPLAGEGRGEGFWFGRFSRCHSGLVPLVIPDIIHRESKAGVRGPVTPYHCHPNRIEMPCAGFCPGCSARSPSRVTFRDALNAKRLPSR